MSACKAPGACSRWITDASYGPPGNFDPAPLPGITKAVSDSAFYHHNAWAAETYEGLHPDAPVALIGTGLTGVDVVLRLRELGHRGRIISVSRHGMFPNGHDDYTTLSSS